QILFEKLSKTSRVSDIDIEKEDEKINYLSRVIYNGFYAFEALSPRNLDESLCGICGNIPVMLIGDANQKDCCNLTELEFDQGDHGDGKVDPDDFWSTVHENLVSASVVSHPEIKKMNAYRVAPFIPPALRGTSILNTEFQKQS
ncbi:unnamed protein product, partial [Owenia fusiformis]